MIDHVVLIRPAGTVTERTAEIVRVLTALRALVPGMRSLRAGLNVAPEKYRQAYEVGLLIRFDSRAALDEYNRHPEHVAAVKRLAELTRGDFLVLDLEY